MRTWHMLLSPAALGCFACGSETGPSGPPADIAGGWRVSEVLSAAATTCTDAGILTITQSAGTFTATITQSGTCVGPTGAADNSGSGTGSGQVTAGTIDFQIPPCHYRGSVSGTPPDAGAGSVSCPSGSATFAGTWQAARGGDLAAPAVSATATAPAGDSSFVPGDTVLLDLDASDTQQLGWVGYRLGAPALGSDSVAVTGTHVTRRFAVATPVTWTGDVMVFARDDAGTPVQRDTMLRVQFGYVRHPTRSVPLAARVRDLAFDAKRNALYLSQPDSQRVSVLSLASYTYGAPFAMPSVPAGLDLTRGGDSLLVALRRAAALAVVDLTQTLPRVDTIRLTFDTSLGRGPDALRVVSNGKAIVSLTFDGIGDAGGVLDYDVATRTSHVRTDVGIGGVVTEQTVLASSVDRTRLLLMIWNECCPVKGAVYDAGADAFVVQQGTVGSTQPPTTADGDRFLIGGTVFTSTLSPVVTLIGITPGGQWPPTAISPDGSVVYVGDYFGLGYSKLRVSDGALLERVRLPAPATRLTVGPDGHTLIAEAVPLPFSAQTSRLFVVSLP